MLHNNNFPLSMSFFPQHIFQPDEPKPQFSYIGLIAMAILSSTETKLVLSDIYQYILDKYPYFRTRGPGWRNSIRHNLSLNDCFIKSGRSSNGKGHYWAIHPANIEDFRKGDFRRRKAQRKVRKHMGLPLDDAGTESLSPPPPSINLTSPPSSLVSASLLRLAPTACDLEGPNEFPLISHWHSLGYITRKHQFDYLLHPYSLSFQYAQDQQKTHGSYFGATIMEHCMPMGPSLYNTSRLTDSTLSYDKYNDIGSNNNTIDNNYESSKYTCNNSITTGRTLNSIGSLADHYNGKPKRPFDVASLLAPDCKDFSLTTSKYNTLSEKDQHNKQHGLSHSLQKIRCRQLTVTSSSVCEEREQEEIVDVVSSDIEEKLDEIFDKTQINRDESLAKTSFLFRYKSPDTQKLELSSSTEQSDIQTCYATKFFSPSSTTHIMPLISKLATTATMVDCVQSENNICSVNQVESSSHSIASYSTTQQQQHVRRLMHQLHQQIENLEKLDADGEVQEIGHFCGAYMAETTGRISTMRLAQLQRQKLPMQLQQ